MQYSESASYRHKHYEIAPIETCHPKKVGYHDALCAPKVRSYWQSLLSPSMNLCLHKEKEFSLGNVSSTISKQRIRILTSNVVDLESFHSNFLLGIEVSCQKTCLS